MASSKSIARQNTDIVLLAATFVGIVCIVSSGNILNAAIYARLAPFFGIGREIGTLLSAVSYAIFAAVAYKRPSWLQERSISLALVCALVFNAFFLPLALSSHYTLAIVGALAIRSLCTAWATTLLGLALAQLGSWRQVLLVCGLGGIAANVAWLFGSITGVLEVDAAVLCGLVAVVILILTPQVKDACAQIRGVAPAELSSVWDRAGIVSRVRFGQLIGCMFFVSIAAGLSLTLNEVHAAPVSTGYENIIVFVAVMGLVLSGRHARVGFGDGLDGPAAPRVHSRVDGMFALAVLLIVAGYVLVPQTIFEPEVSNSLLRAGRDCFGLLIWMFVAAVGTRSPFALLLMGSIVRMSSSLGTDVGAASGHELNVLLASSPAVANTISACIVVGFVAFLWLGFRSFSFAEVILGVPQSEGHTLESLDQSIQKVCDTLSVRFGLTGREGEILFLLAQGRDGKYIANDLVLSYNTVKTHIKHVYQKLQVHTRQELVDLIRIETQNF